MDAAEERPSVRRVRGEDADALLRVAAELVGDVGGDATVALGELLDSPDHAVFVAEFDGALVGWAHVFLARRVGLSMFAEIGGLVTVKAFRRRGVGRLMVNACKAWAHEHGSSRLRVRCSTRREGANRFYQMIGFGHLKQQTVYEKQD